MPVKNEIAKVSMRGTVDDTGALNTYVEKTIDTNLSFNGQHAFIVTGILFRHDGVLNGNRNVDITLAYETQNAAPQPSDPSFIFGASWASAQLTSGSVAYNNAQYQDIDHFPIAVQSIFLGLKTANMGAATTAHVKLYGYHMKISQADFFRLAQSR